MAKEIELTRRQVAIVDDNMFDELSKYKWFVTMGGGKNAKYYASRFAYINGKKSQISMHRHILGLARYDGIISDHVNRNTLDNRRHNLRVADFTINNRNRGLETTNTSGYKGVSWDISRDKWMAHITVNDRQINLGRYDLIDDAIEARTQGERRHW